MLIHYLKITFRNLWKYKTQSLTGIFGLAFGLACFIPALYWMRYETSYDSFYPAAESIYRVYAVEKQSGKVNKGLSPIFAKSLKEQFPAVESAAVFVLQPEKCKTEKHPHIQFNMLYVDSTFLSVFPQEIIRGESESLRVINNMALTEAMAVRLFGDVDKALGQKIQTTMNPAFPPYTVTLVIKDPPVNTNLSFNGVINHDMIKHFATAPEEAQWGLFFMDLYVKLYPDTDIDRFTNELRDFTSKLGVNTGIELLAMPISDVRHKLETNAPFTLNFIGLFVVAGVLLLFSAIFNFLNLHLDLFRQRLRELRLRKVHGASGGRLIRQMLFELCCSILLALLLACYFVFLIRPVFSNLLNIEMPTAQLLLLFAVCGTGIMVLMLLAGFLTFLRLSHLVRQPQSEGKITKQPALRRMAVTLQLAVSILFIISALVVMMQMHFVSHKDLGFDTKGIIQVSGFVDPSGRIQKKLTQELSLIPHIESITDAYFEPQHNVSIYTVTTAVEWPGKELVGEPVFNFIPTDCRFAETFGLTMRAGQWWSEGQALNIVLNEEAVRVMRLADPIGSIVKMPSLEDASIIEEYRVVGVVSDFHTLSLRHPIQPTIFRQSLHKYNVLPVLYLRVLSGKEWEVIEQITAKLPDIDVTLADARSTPIRDLYDKLNLSEQTGLKMFSVLAIVCLLISLFGIYAVAIASTQRRRKEIAIRKVAGAQLGHIIRMFFREYTWLVLIAGAFALPLAYLMMSDWLQGYAYRIAIPWWLFIVVIAGVIVVVLLTVFGQVLKAANSNPSEVVKNE